MACLSNVRPELPNSRKSSARSFVLLARTADFRSEQTLLKRANLSLQSAFRHGYCARPAPVTRIIVSLRARVSSNRAAWRKI